MPWVRLGLLRERCDVKIESRLVRNGGEHLRWRMTVIERDKPRAKPIMAEADEIADAVRQGVDAAEKAGLISN